MSDLDHQMWLHMPQTQKIVTLLTGAKEAAEQTLLNDADLHRSGVWPEVFAEYQVIKRVLSMVESAEEKPNAAAEEPDNAPESSWTTLIDSLDVD